MTRHKTLRISAWVILWIMCNFARVWQTTPDTRRHTNLFRSRCDACIDTMLEFMITQLQAYLHTCTYTSDKLKGYLLLLFLTLHCPCMQVRHPYDPMTLTHRRCTMSCNRRISSLPCCLILLLSSAARREARSDRVFSASTSYTHAQLGDPLCSTRRSHNDPLTISQ